MPYPCERYFEQGRGPFLITRAAQNLRSDLTPYVIAKNHQIKKIFATLLSFHCNLVIVMVKNYRRTLWSALVLRIKTLKLDFFIWAPPKNRDQSLSLPY